MSHFHQSNYIGSSGIPDVASSDMPLPTKSNNIAFGDYKKAY
jgi:hypothetical protein